jgi:hypothetical protein
MWAATRGPVLRVLGVGLVLRVLGGCGERARVGRAGRGVGVGLFSPVCSSPQRMGRI